jgi:hypothetical protein
MEQLPKFNINFTEEELLEWIHENLGLKAAQKRKLQGRVEIR